ncbi:RagB/SusD family nutrient uptake outer membrane protein [Chitinophaga deserti]|uniref:RagB/SusD family nutrient uptake outer membrane protein n=1 Tax=Chitinophaga deserti TaxID=2164099 RepID=UPI000D6B710D|nr:RagB/SusD family nutrient uptake outer membrane protein [Chitinophaga deserti]
MRKIIIAILAAGAFAGSACKKDFLNRYPTTSVSPQLFFKSESDLSMYIFGLLNHSGSGIYLSEQGTDNCATTGNQTIINMMTSTPNSRNMPSAWSWGRLRNINYFLENYQQAKVTDDVKNHYAGLARYYRAMFYMDKIKTYSDVPWYGRTLNPSDTALLYAPRTPRAQVMDSVIADLVFASQNVKESVPSGTPGLWAVKATYARIALYEGTFRKYHPELNLAATANRFLDSARKQALDVMNSGKFTLAAKFSDNFNSLDLSGSKEVILNCPYDVTKKGGSSANNNSTVFGDYEQSPSRDLVQTFLMKDGTRFTDKPNYNQFGFVEEFTDRDPRLGFTIVPPGFVRLPATRPYVQTFSNNFTGYHQLKGYFNFSTDGQVIGSTDVPSIRYAEVLLTYAEAVAEMGTATQTDIDNSIGLLRGRVNMPGLNMAAANGDPDPVLAAQYPAVQGANKGLILEVRRERRVELAMEGYRYDDIMRWYAGKRLQIIPLGMYFPGLGQYDLTGDGVADVILISKNTAIPPDSEKIKNSLGVTLIYYKTGNYAEPGVAIYLENGEAGGRIVTGTTARTFAEPKFYYYPVPFSETSMNPNLKQLFGWD